MNKYLQLGFMLLLGTGGAAINFVSAYYYPHWKIYHGRSKIPMSVRGKIEAGRYAAYWTLGIILMLVWGLLFYLGPPDSSTCFGDAGGHITKTSEPSKQQKQSRQNQTATQLTNRRRNVSALPLSISRNALNNSAKSGADEL